MSYDWVGEFDLNKPREFNQALAVERAEAVEGQFFRVTD